LSSQEKEHIYADGCTRTVRVAAIPVGATLKVDANDNVSGIYRDLLERITRESGCSFEYVHMPVNRAYEMFKHGQIDIIPVTIRTRERDESAVFIKTTGNRLMAVYLKGGVIPRNTLSGLSAADIRIDIIRGQSFGGYYDTWVKSRGKRSRVEDVTTTDQAVQKLIAGRSDLVLIPLSAIAESVIKYGVENKIAFQIIEDVPPLEIGCYLSKSSLSVPELDFLRNKIEQLVQNGYYYELVKKYYPVWARAGIIPAHREK
jgi:ABC-type amino acid transport substrate-binding protein